MNMLICSDFFGYYKNIMEEIKLITNEETVWFSDRPTNSMFGKAILRSAPFLMYIKIAIYQKKILNYIINNNVTRIIIVFGETIRPAFLKKIKKINPSIKIVYYSWDCISIHPFQLKLMKCSDVAYSFDRNDSKKYNVNYLPLFYISTFKKLGTATCSYKYDYSYIGTIQKGKYEVLKRIIKAFSDKNGFVWPYIQSRFVYRYKKIFYDDLRNTRITDFKYTKLTFDQISNIYDSSFCIIDIPTRNSTGLTMRFFEALGMKKKIITTCKDVVNYDFYREENIYIFEDTIDFNHAFFRKEYKELPEDVYLKYSIHEWTKTLLGFKED